MLYIRKLRPSLNIQSDSVRAKEFVNNNSLEYYLTLGILELVTVCWHGVGGLTVVKLKEFDLAIVSEYKPDIRFLQHITGYSWLSYRRVCHPFT